MAQSFPIFRIFDVDKAREFYLDWLGFTVDWQHNPEGAPIYMQISLKGVRLHLSEHHGDCSPGARVLIEEFPEMPQFHAMLMQKNYPYNRPGLERAFYDTSLWCMEVTDPFSNRLTFTGK